MHQDRGVDRGSVPAVLFERYADLIYNYCFRRCGSWSLAEDLTATVFLEVWRGKDRIVEVDGSALPWLYGVATNVCRNHRRSVRRGSAAMSRLRLSDIQPDPADEVVDRIDEERRMAAVRRRLAGLPAGDRDAFYLVIWEELSYAEAAAALGVPVGTIRSRISRVRRLLRLDEAALGEGGVR